MLRFASISRQKLIETTVGFPKLKRIGTMIRFASISRRKLVEKMGGFLDKKGVKLW